MGVHGLWSLLEPVGKPIPLESLENKVLAVDVSIWLHQATKGFRDKQGNSVPNAHLLGLCHRLCKLLFFKIKPVFVFDGGVPVLKRQTMALRHSRRDTAVKSNSVLEEKILKNYIQSEVINKQLGKQDEKLNIPMLRRKNQEPDLFELPPIPKETIEEMIADSDDESDMPGYGDMESVFLLMKGHNIHSVDFSSETFLALPAEVQHEILLELRNTRKQSSWNRIHQMPQEADDFSGFQVERLLKRRHLQQRLDEVTQQIAKKSNEQYALSQGDVVESQKLVADSSTHYVLIKKALEHVPNPVKVTTRKETVNVSEGVVHNTSIPIDEDSDVDEDLMKVSEEFTQEELFTILSGDQNQTSVVSSSDDDSDFVEVPSPVVSEPNQVILDVSINPSLLVEDDDMFMDVFGPSAKTIAKEAPMENESLISSEELVRSYVSSATLNDRKEYAKISENLIDANASSIGHNPAEPVPDSCIADSENVKEVQILLQNSPTISKEIASPKTSSASLVVETTAVSLKAGEVSVNKEKMMEIEVTAGQTGPNDGEKAGLDNGPKPLLADQVLPKSPKVLNEPPVMSTERREELETLGRIINQEQSTLIQQHGKQERLASSITDQMYLESQELLRLFGIPYLVAPMEAEAQCAFLDEAGLTQGTITDDSDIWLFGGRRVYKNFFNQGKYVQFFEADDIYEVFKLDREKLIRLALLTGSDYTEGIQGVGPVCALEIMAEFPSDGLEALEQFRDWLQKVQAKKNSPPENKIRQKIRNLQVRPGK